MPNLKDLVLFGPKLALDIGTGVLSSLRRLVEDSEPIPESRPPDPDPRDDVDLPDSPADDDLPDVHPNVPQAIGGGFPEPPGQDPNDLSKHDDPHHVLNTPVEEILNADPGDLEEIEEILNVAPGELDD